MKTRVRIEQAPGVRSVRYAAEKLLAAELRLPLADARVLLAEVPTILPRTEAEGGGGLIERLAGVGVQATLVPVPDGSERHCSEHTHLLEGGHCSECLAPLCVLCLRGRGSVCSRCRAKTARKRRWQRIRVGVLLLVLAFVSAFALLEYRHRHPTWHSPERVAVVLVQPAGESVRAERIVAFRERAPVVEERMAAEFARHGRSGHRPFLFRVFGPVVEPTLPPDPPEDGLRALFDFNRALGDYADAVDRVLGESVDEHDTRIYLRISTPEVATSTTVEGLSQHRGKLGVVSAELTNASIDFAWFVTVHELFHTRGALDKYDASGRARVPDGLADPLRQPLFPQDGTEVMARGRPMSESSEDAPGPVATWVVGEWTAREVGWIR